MTPALERLRQIRDGNRRDGQEAECSRAPNAPAVAGTCFTALPEPPQSPRMPSPADDAMREICRRARTWPQAVTLLLNVRGGPNGGTIGADFFDALDALHALWDQDGGRG